MAKTPNTITVDVHAHDVILDELTAYFEGRAQDLDEFRRRYCNMINGTSISIEAQAQAFREAAAIIHRRKMMT